MKTRPAKDTQAAADADALRLLEVVAALVAEVGDGRGGTAISLDSALDRDLGLGSLERVELAGRVEAAFSVRLPEEGLATAATPRDLLELVRARRAEASPRRSPRPPPRPRRRKGVRREDRPLRPSGRAPSSRSSSTAPSATPTSST